VGERDDARHQVEQKRERMSQLAHEVSRRMTPEYAKERAREMARDRMYRARDRAVESSWFGPLLGAGIGALVAKSLQSRAQDRRDRERYGSGYPYRDVHAYPREWSGYAVEREEYDLYGADVGLQGEASEGAGETGSSLGEKASETKERARAKAEELKDRARAKSEEVKGRFQEATSSLRERLPDRERARQSAYEDTGLWAFGALALGALFGLALPETQRERELLEPARRKARELGEEAKEKVLAKGSEVMEKATEKVASAGEQRQQQPPPMTGGSPGVPPLH
jgi:ElaB/YqjD/DUF883 family membrane-anchored ribosome-binding protein